MKMTNEEAIAILQAEYDYCKSGYDLEADPEEECLETTKYLRALHVAISALRPLTREQVEKVWRGEWILYLAGDHIMPERYYSCSKCGDKGYTSKRNFCDSCGAPMTDEAVEMVMERLEGMDNGTVPCDNA